jgi:hypothetical protein
LRGYDNQSQPWSRVNLLTGGRVLDLRPKCPAQPTSEPVLARAWSLQSAAFSTAAQSRAVAGVHQLEAEFFNVGSLLARPLEGSTSFVFRLPLCHFPSVSGNHHLRTFGRHRPGASQGFSQSCCPRRWFPFSLSFCHPHSASLAAPSFVIALYVFGHSL